MTRAPRPLRRPFPVQRPTRNGFFRALLPYVQLWVAARWLLKVLILAGAAAWAWLALSR